MMQNEFLKRILSSIILIPLSIFFIVEGSLLFNLFITICFFISFYEWHKISNNKSYSILGFLFITFSFFAIYRLRNDYGFEIILFILTVCISTDIGGYIFGKIFKGPKLTKISPKKTYAGTIGGYLLSIIITIGYLNMPYLNNFLFFSKEVLLIVFLISTISQMGDLFISFFKRLSKVKDTGKLIPGHGGILDRIDGMLFAFPFSYLIFKFNLFY